MSPGKKNPGFNDLLADLEEVVAQLENDEATLEASLAAFEKGVALTQAAQKLLAEAEQKVQLLTASAEGEPELEDCDDEDDL